MGVKVFMLDAWAIVRVLRWQRMINAFIVIMSYYWSYLTKKVKQAGKPIAFSVEPTNICNLRCPECPTGVNTLKRPVGNMEMPVYRKLINQLAPELIYLNLYVQGEPMMHPQFAEMVKYASGHGVYVSTSTNGHFLTRPLAVSLVSAGLTRLIFSVDGTTQESYQKYRIGGDLERVKESIRNIVEAKMELNSAYPIIVIQFLVFQHNEYELPQIKRMAKELNVDKLEIKTAQLNDFGTLKPPENNRFSRYADAVGKVLKGNMKNRCWRQWHSAVVTWDGKIAPCCYDKDALFAFGNIKQQSVQEILFSKASNDFKKLIFNGKHQINMCNNCPEGRK